MPLITYTCECKHSISKFFRQAKDSPAFFTCEKCGQEAKKTMSVPTSGSKITIDTPGMARAIEVVPDIIELNQQRSDKNYKEE